jgi:hypothetical protein
LFTHLFLCVKQRYQIIIMKNEEFKDRTGGRITEKGGRKRRMENGEWKMENGERRREDGKRH